MKKIVSSLVCAALLAASLGSCAYSPADFVRTSSGNADRYLSRLPDGSAVFCGESADGVDMSGFDDDGYVLSVRGGEVTVLAKTDAGLDRAVRYYNNHVTESDFAKTYGENGKIGKITLCGHDISEFSISVPAEVDESCFIEAYDHAAELLHGYIYQACRADLPIVKGHADGMTVEFVCDTTQGFTDDAYRLVTDEGGLKIYGTIRGCQYGMYAFLEKYIGYRFLSLNNTYLYEADEVEVPVGIDESAAPAFFHRSIYDGADVSMNPDYTMSLGLITWMGTDYGGSAICETCHGYSTYIPSVGPDHQPCLTDESIYEECLENLIAEARAVEATYPGFKDLGKRQFHLGQNDNTMFCTCPGCRKIRSKEQSQAGLNVNFCNRIAEDMNAVFDSDIYIAMFAYWGAVEPPKNIRPNHFVQVTYCMYQLCWNHPVTGELCDPESLTVDALTNARHLEYLRRWCEITDIVNVYLYGTSSNQFCPVIPKWYRENMREIADAGAYGVMTYGSFDNPILGKLTDYIFGKLMWDPHMSDEEYDALYKEAMRLFYGESWEYTDMLYDIYCEAKTGIECHSNYYGSYVNYGILYDNFDAVIALSAEAVRGCETETQEKAAKAVGTVVTFNALIAGYDMMYKNGTAEEKAYFTELYRDNFAELMTLKDTFSDYWTPHSGLPTEFDPDRAPTFVYDGGEGGMIWD